MNDEPIVDSITKALAYTENGGAPDIKNPKAGKTGELPSIFQIEPDTWKNYSKQVIGKEVPLTPEAETYVVHNKVGQWYQEDLKDGVPPDEIPSRIASRWNAGTGEPDAYKGKFSNGTSSAGVNEKYGVKYDVPGYVDKFNKYLGDFSNSSDQSVDQNKQAAGQDQNGETQDKGDSTNSNSLAVTPGVLPQSKQINATALPQLSVNQGLIKRNS